MEIFNKQDKFTCLIRVDKDSALIDNHNKLQFTFKKTAKESDSDCQKCCFKKFNNCASIPCTTVQRVDNKNGYYICTNSETSEFIFKLNPNQLKFKQL